jgi:MarC family membrane protein
MDVFIYLVAALFSVLNPIGTIPIFVGLTQDYTKNERAKVSLTTSINVAVILLISFLVGQYVLTFFGITITALRIAGGIIITNSGFSLLNGNFSKNKGINKQVEREVQTRQHIALTPLAMPMLAGPGSISLLIAYYQDHQSTHEILFSCLAIVAVAFAIYLILRSGHYLAKILGSSGIVAISRIIGFLTIAIGIQYIISALLSIIFAKSAMNLEF